MRITWPIAVAIAAASLLAFSCTGTTDNDSTTDDDDDDDDGGAGGVGGAGGAGGEGGDGDACEADCSKIEAPLCHRAQCNVDTKKCEIVPADGDPCDDGLFCTVNDACLAGVCEGGGPNDCGMEPGECTAPVCDETMQACNSAPASEGFPCVIDDLCIVNAACKNGLCTGAPKDCFFAPGGECNVVVCNPTSGKCEPTVDNSKDGQPCSSSGDLCMVGKLCSGGSCLGGTPKDCSAQTFGCNNGLCDAATGQCFAEPIAEGEMCLEATDTCNVGICDAMGQCIATPANDGGTCEDGNSCTLGETCAAGSCQGGVMGGYEAYFTETFASNAAGWTLGTEWAIGPAATSACSAANEDPAMDHTPDADNGVAGVVIGGCAAQTLHAMYWLESPAIDTTVAAGPVWLEFWRHLNSDYTPFMNNRIEVFNGSAWILVWESLGNNPEDLDWTHVSHELTAHKNAAMKIRFGFDIGSTGVFSEASWNIDDVTVANQVCN